VFHGSGDVVGLACGGLFTLSQASVSRFNREYLITGLRHVIEAEAHRTRDPDVAGVPGWIDNDREHNYSLEVNLSGFFGVFRLRIVDRSGSRHPGVRVSSAETRVEPVADAGAGPAS